MSDIANLQEAIETARTAYAHASEQHTRSRKHAQSLIHIVEEQLRDKRIEMSQNDIQRERMTHEHSQLRQMLHALVMAVETGADGTPESDPTAIGTRPNGVTPLAPVGLGSEPMEPGIAAVDDPKPRRTPTKAESAKHGASGEELRAGLKRVLMNKRIPAAALETVQADRTEAPNPAE